MPGEVLAPHTHSAWALDTGSLHLPSLRRAIAGLRRPQLATSRGYDVPRGTYPWPHGVWRHNPGQAQKISGALV